VVRCLGSKDVGHHNFFSLKSETSQLVQSKVLTFLRCDVSIRTQITEEVFGICYFHIGR